MQAMSVNAKKTSENRLDYPSRFFASLGIFATLGDHSLQGQIVLVRGLAEVGVEAVVAECQRVVVGAGLFVLYLPDAAAFDQIAGCGAAENVVRGGHRVRSRDGFTRDVEVQDQGRDEAFPLGALEVGAGSLMRFVVKDQSLSLRSSSSWLPVRMPMLVSSTSPSEFDFDGPGQGAKIAGGQTESEHKLRQSFADRGGAFETFA